MLRDTVAEAAPKALPPCDWAGEETVCVCAAQNTAENKIKAREMVFTRFSNLGEIQKFLIVCMVRHTAANAKDRKD